MRIVVIRCDDLCLRDMAIVKPGGGNLFSAVLTNFPRSWKHSLVAGPICDPSRVSFLTGQYIHNHGVTVNGVTFQGTSTLATDLAAAGWTCVQVGKHLTSTPVSSGGAIGSGWTEWYTTQNGRYFDYDQNENGAVVHRGTDPADYQADVVASRAEEVLERIVDDLFMVVDFTAPHLASPPYLGSDLPVAAPRHAGTFASYTPNIPAAYDFQEAPGTPAHELRAPLTPAEHQRILDLARARADALLAVDEGVLKILRELEMTDVAFFTTDNGWHAGEHRIVQGKSTPYEEAIRAPLYARGLGTGENSSRVVSGIDLAPTILELANTPAVGRVLDGESLLQPRVRTHALVESWVQTHPGWREFELIRSTSRKYVLYHEGGQIDEETGPTGIVEIARDLIQDPDEIAYKEPSASELMLLADLKVCSGGGCSG